MHNIEPVVKNDLCTQCGTCVAVCPVDAITLKQHKWRGLIPKIDEAVCTRCKKCLKVCPGDELDMDALQKQLFGSLPEDPFFGHCLGIYSGYSHDPDIRYNGASGGIVSHMLITLLEQGRIDGALVVQMGSERPLEPEVFIAKTREEILSAQQSKYIPVPMNTGLREILRNQNKKYAMVAVPCHLHGLRLMENLFPQLKKQIVLTIGLFCGFNPTLNSTKFLATRAGVKNFDQIKKIKYRDGDWPCGFRAEMKDGTDHILYPIKEFLFSHYIFERQRCAMCQDHYAELADISVGDEWRADLKESKGGWCFIITRTSVGAQVLDAMVSEGLLHVEKTSKEAIWSGQGGTTIFKKKGAFAFARIRHLFFKKSPAYLNHPQAPIPTVHYVVSFLLYCVTSLFNIGIIWRLFLRFPTALFTRFRWIMIKAYRDW